MVLPSLFYKTLQILYFQYYLQIISKDIKKANTCFFNRCNTSFYSIQGFLWIIDFIINIFLETING